VAIEVVAGTIFVSYLFVIQKKKIDLTDKYFLSIMLFILINVGWITGAGINLLNTSLYFLCLSVGLILIEKKFYPFIFVLVLINLTGFFLLQYYTSFLDAKVYGTEQYYLINDYLTAAFFIFIGGYFIAFLKSNCTSERSNLNKVNRLLKEKSDEISYQNEELRRSKETLDQTIKKLEDQASELMDIQGSLEEKVNERTNDLLKLNERLIAQNQQLEQYAYITSHNLRSPIAQIKGLIQVLPEGLQYDDITRETLTRIKVSAENLEKVFSDLSAILKVKKSMQQPWQEVDVHAEIEGVIDSIKASAIKKGIRIINPAQQAVTIKALRPYVYSVFHNIIENAVKYSDEAKPNSYIKIDIEESPKFHIATITDNGIGIDMAVASGKIFNMYQRFNNTHPGQGFGLFLVKSQMEAMEGKVELESILGQGTTFNLYFAKR
jgi:signal transduction histidine kinase